MKTFPLLLICLLAISCSTSKKAPKPVMTEEEHVKAAFDQYKSAILNDKGAVAVEFVDSRTIAYYADMLEHTKRSDSTTVDNLKIMDKLMVLSIRHRTPKEDILSFDGKKLLVYAIQEGMVGKNSVVNNEIGKIEIEGDFATGQLVARGVETPVKFHFYKEQDSWRVDLTSIFPVANEAFRQMADQSGQTENDYLLMLLEMITGKQPTHDIWKMVE